MSHHTLTRAQRWSDNIATFCGSWGFVLSFSLGIMVWMAVSRNFDPYPFILLNLALTVVSTMQSPIIMMSQNRQVERDKIAQEIVAERDRETVRALGAKLDQVLENQKKILDVLGIHDSV